MVHLGGALSFCGAFFLFVVQEKPSEIEANIIQQIDASNQGKRRRWRNLANARALRARKNLEGNVKLSKLLGAFRFTDRCKSRMAPRKNLEEERQASCRTGHFA